VGKSVPQSGQKRVELFKEFSIRPKSISMHAHSLALTPCIETNEYLSNAQRKAPKTQGIMPRTLWFRFVKHRPFFPLTLFAIHSQNAWGLRLKCRGTAPKDARVLKVKTKICRLSKEEARLHPKWIDNGLPRLG
jgi:hypothetical protein